MSGHAGDHSVEQDTVRAILLMLGGVFMFSTMDLALKQLVAHYPSMQVVFLRCALSAPLFALWIGFANRRLFKPRRFNHHLLRAMVGLLMLYAVNECLREMQLADAYAIFFAAPLLITILSGLVMQEPAGPWRLTASVVGFAGVLVVLQPGVNALISYGSLMGLLSVVAYSVVVLLLRSLGRTEHSLTIALWFTTLIGIGAAFLAFPGWKPLQFEHWPWLVVLSITGTLGQIGLTAAFRRASAAVIAPLDYLHMFWAVLYGWYFWGHIPGQRTWTGTAIIVASGLFILFREAALKRNEVSLTTPTA